MRKSTIFIVCLLCIVVGELFMLFKGGKVGIQNYALDTKVYDMPVRETEYKVVKPFLFEMHAADEVDAILDDFVADITQRMKDTDFKINEVKVIPQQELIQDSQEAEILQIEDEDLAVAKEDVQSENIEPEAEQIVEENLVQKEVVKDEPKLNQEQIDEDIPEEKKVEKISEPEKAAVIDSSAKVAVVIDDLGLSVPFTRQIAQVKAPLTVSFLPYGASNKEQVTALKNAGFEVMLHVPMMPHVPAALAPVTLSPEMDKAETQTELDKMINRFEGTGMSGVNNHMGSLLTERTKNMGYVMEVLKKHNMYFLDSKTTGKSVAEEVAKEYGVAYISRDVFLDNKNDYNYIMGQFRQTEKIAKKNGHAVAIGHPYSQTLKALQDWLKEAENSGIKVVHLSELLAK